MTDIEHYKNCYFHAPIIAQAIICLFALLSQLIFNENLSFPLKNLVNFNEAKQCD